MSDPPGWRRRLQFARVRDTPRGPRADGPVYRPRGQHLLLLAVRNKECRASARRLRRARTRPVQPRAPEKAMITTPPPRPRTKYG
eukprot:scaffold13706_cov121-Isochrysis_galbana.AAC.15